MHDAFYGLLISALWIAWVIYWRIAARDFKPVVRRESLRSRISHIAPLVASVLLLAAPPHAILALSHLIWPRNLIVYWIGFVLLAAGLLYTVWARRHLAGNWSATVTLKQNHELTRSGPYRFTRHPIYTGLLVGFVGSAVALDEWRGVIAVAFAAYAFVRKLRIEERFLAEHFGAQYDAYRKEVRALIPGIY